MPLYGLDEDGPRAGSPVRFGRYLAAARTTPFRWAIYYEREGYANPSVETIRADLEYIRDGNLEIYEGVRGLTGNAETAWAPGLIVDRRPYELTEVTVFSFGMAHKVRTDMFRRLRGRSTRSAVHTRYAVSAANHETATLEDAEAVFAEMREVFPGFYFLGNLSDVAVYNELRRATFFAAFFDKGVRANNTSVAAAMETGAVVITNLDELSPPEYVHLENVIDIERCEELPTDPGVLDGIRERAVETAAARGWDALVAQLVRA